VIIEVDISGQKYAEQQIEQQNSEIEAQRDVAVRQRDLLSLQKKELIDSIFYAKKIQSAVLPKTKDFNKIFERAFVLDMPRDIVGGDFFWTHQIEDVKIIAAVDCTGHGVPGAFLSLIGHSILNQLIREYKIFDPNIVLDKLREQIISWLGQTGKDGESKDGMDISICVVNTLTKEISYSGANSPVCVVSNGELTEYKADKMPISIYHLVDMPFSIQRFAYKQGDMLYLYSDGYADQFGGEKGKKLKSRVFRHLLTDISPLTVEQQSKELYNSFHLWKADYQQIDDVMVIVIRLE
jgi:serine phosphatase RsbU (regulator of sigma subunit)